MEKNGFTKCGIIYVKDGTPRIAYHWTDRGSTERVFDQNEIGVIPVGHFER